MRKGQPIKVHVSSRIMIDAVFFQEANPNYTRPRINECVQQGSPNGGWIIFGTDDRSTSQSDQVKSNGKDPAAMDEDDLVLCSPVVPGFSYGNKLWGELRFSSCLPARSVAKLTRCAAEFAVADIKGITWHPASFARLAIPSKQKEVIQALAEAHTSRGSDHTFDDFVVGKGRGLIVLMQYGLQAFFFTMLTSVPAGLQASARL